MKGALDVHRELLARDVPHEIVRLRGSAAGTADDLPRALDVDPLACVAVRCYITDVGFAAVLVPADRLPEPAALLDALDGYSRRYGVGEMATVVYAEADLQSRRVSYACAGHPPPVLAEPGAAARFAWDGRSLPLDAAPRPQPRAEGVVDAAPGSTLLLYTDGLIERHDRPLHSGLDALLAAVEGARAETPEALAVALAERMASREGPPDDVCVLAFRLPQ